MSRIVPAHARIQKKKYAHANLVDHLIHGNQIEKLYGLLARKDWRDEKRSLHGTDISFARDVSKMIRAIPKSLGALPMMVGAVWLNSAVLNDIGNFPPEFITPLLNNQGLEIALSNAVLLKQPDKDRALKILTNDLLGRGQVSDAVEVADLIEDIKNKTIALRDIAIFIEECSVFQEEYNTIRVNYKYGYHILKREGI